MLKKFTLYSFALALVCLLSQSSLFAQEKASPPRTAEAEVNGKTITINYSSPSKKDRKIWDGLVKYDKVWRTGANEATTLEVSEDVKIGGKSLKKGKYAIFTIPNENSWTIIINSNPNQWGAYNYDKEMDVLRFDVKPNKNKLTEMFTISISEAGLVTMAWDEVKVEFTIQ
ncbi:DUF2911 domain-containing protein [Reichenbachiella agarivorans]|uniref:DUF2911 domain-containing protein n=1 Tax=Reichenbachiella agarivorans TaxID=2979464 RepID=A0ABY6CQR0_9BACT|nr:DUF2911 domain-containing protein [Reichenbachiella agarivorans]UXP32861.1 DUF2911 domain-containing protein [Reichenbachiella agarivorans]